MASENETIADIVAELRIESKKVRTVIRPDGYGDYEEITLEGNPHIKNLADRIEAAWEREREASEDETLVKSCNTCKHFTRKRKWCLVHDYSPHDPSTLPLIWPDGPCPQWECKYNSH